MDSEKYAKSKDEVSQTSHPAGLTEDLFTDDAVDPVYQARARILNDALQEIGMGKYQW